MRSPLVWVGGKNRLANKIISMLPPHLGFIEVFGGSGAVLFRKEPSKVEVLNDLDNSVFNFFRVVQNHSNELIRYLSFCLIGRKWFQLFSAQNPDTLTDIQKAARSFYLQRTAWAGLVRQRSYHYHVVQPPGLNPARIPEMIEKAHQRLQRVQIECLKWEEILEKYDRPQNLFYADPPYWGEKALYNLDFAPADFVRLANQLRGLKGKFILSLNDVPEVRSIFKEFCIHPVRLAYSAQKKAGKLYNELLITNFRTKSS